MQFEPAVIAEFFIERPVLANVIAILMLVLGGVALARLPVAQYPQLTPPTIQVTTSFPGASALTVQQQVARPIEQQVNGVEGMIYMQSNSANDGRYALTVSFAVGTNTDQAQIAVQNRVAIACRRCRRAVQQQGVSTKKKSTAILEIVTLTSDEPAPRRAVPEQLRGPRSCATGSRGCPASPTSTCSASASTACGSGSMRRNERARPQPVRRSSA